MSENVALKQSLEKIKEGAIEILMEKEQEILTLKMKLEKLEYSSTEKTTGDFLKFKKFNN